MSALPTRAHRLANPSARLPALRPLALALLLAPVLALQPVAQAQSQQGNAGGEPPMPAARSRAPVTLNFTNADIEMVSRTIGAMLDRQIVVDPRVKGQITINNEKAMPPQEAWRTYLAALRGLGFTVVENAGLLKVVPEQEAKLQAGTVSIGAPTARGDQILTQIFRLNHENPNNLVAVLRPLISANNTINANVANGTLIITDYADNLQRLAKIIAALDQPAASEVEVFPIKNALAADLAPLVQRLTEGAGTGGVTPGAQGLTASQTSIVVEARSNSLVVRTANPARMAAVRNLVQKLDQPTAGGGPAGNIWVVYLKNADAVKMAEVLRAAMASGASASSGGSTTGSSGSSPRQATGIAGTGVQSSNTNSGVGSSGSSGASPQSTSPVSASAGPSTGGMIQADPSTNSLIISAPEAVYRQMRSVIDQLDTRRAQVYIESMIVEVSGDNAATFGFQWQGLLGKSGDAYGLIGGTNFGTTGNLLNITGVASAGDPTALSGSVGAGLNIGLLRNFNGAYGLAAIARLLQNTTDTNIVSTPNLITLDNEEAKIVVGQNVPFITGSFTSTGTGTTSPFQTIERKDVGITLRIKPQVGEGGTVRMVIFQESSSIAGVAEGTQSTGPTTNKRSIESSVVVDDGAVLVLGGLIQDQYEVSKNKVPLLGDIPYLGALFRNESRTKKRSNLMVFLRPVIMRDAATAAKITLDRYELIRAQQMEQQPQPNPVLPVGMSPVLPPYAPGPLPTTSSLPVLAPADTQEQK